MPMERQMQQEVFQMNLESNLAEITKNLYGKSIKEASNEELYYAILTLSKGILGVAPEISGDKKIYYVSAEFLIGKLLSNNLINLGIYDKLEEVLEDRNELLRQLEKQLRDIFARTNKQYLRVRNHLRRNPGVISKRYEEVLKEIKDLFEFKG